MNVLLVTSAWPPEGEKNIYTDLMEEFSERGHSAAVAAIGGALKRGTSEANEGIIRVLRLGAAGAGRRSKYLKVISHIAAGPRLYLAVKRRFGRERFDLILFSTPPITVSPFVVALKRLFGATLYLLLKDIWPDDTAIPGGMKKGGCAWRAFRALARYTYSRADFIGCMSDAAVRYLLAAYPEIPARKVEVCPNSRKDVIMPAVDRAAVRRRYGLPQKGVIFVFGGNIGKPQGADFLADAAASCGGCLGVHFLVAGGGTEFDPLRRRLMALRTKTATVMPALPWKQYEELLRACDAGIVLLHPEGTVPHFPSRTLSYLAAGLPVIAATDPASDLGEILVRSGCGFWCLNGDFEGFMRAVCALCDAGTRERMGKNARRLFLDEYTADKSYKVIMRHFGPPGDERAAGGAPSAAEGEAGNESAHG